MSFSPPPNSVWFTKSQSWSSHPVNHLPTTTSRFSLRGSWAFSRFACSRCHQFWCSLGCSCFGKAMEPGAYLLSDFQTWERCFPKKLEQITSYICSSLKLLATWYNLFFLGDIDIWLKHWNKASSIYQQEGLVCWYCLLFAVRVLNTILNHSTTTISQVLYLLEEMDQKLDRQMSYPATQLSVKHPTLFSTTSWFKWFVNMLLFVRRTWVPTDKLAWNNKQRPLLSGLPWVSLSDGHQETLWTNRF